MLPRIRYIELLIMTGNKNNCKKCQEIKKTLFVVIHVTSNIILSLLIFSTEAGLGLLQPSLKYTK